MPTCDTVFNCFSKIVLLQNLTELQKNTSKNNFKHIPNLLPKIHSKSHLNIPKTTRRGADVFFHHSPTGISYVQLWLHICTKHIMCNDKTATYTYTCISCVKMHIGMAYETVCMYDCLVYTHTCNYWCIHSKLDYREFNSRDLFLFYGHNSAPWRRIGSRIGGNESYRPPGPF